MIPSLHNLLKPTDDKQAWTNTNMLSMVIIMLKKINLKSEYKKNIFYHDLNSNVNILMALLHKTADALFEVKNFLL